MMKKSNSRKRILVVTTYFYPQMGGVANHTFNLYSRLVRDHGYDVTVVASALEDNTYFEGAVEGMHVIRLPYLVRLSNTPIHLDWFFKIKRIVDECRPDVVCLHTPVPYMADVGAMASGDVPIILKYHHVGSMTKGKFWVDLLLKGYESTAFKVLLNKSDTIVSASEFTKRNFLASYGKDVVVITPGVDIERFEKVSLVDEPRLLFVASLNKSERYKGLSFLLQAVAKLKTKHKTISLEVVGTGDDLDYYVSLVKELGVEKMVTFRGKLLGDELVEAYKKSRALVHPSLIDSCPNVVLEAMASALPVIGTNSTGIKDVVSDNETGLLFEPKNVDDLAKKIEIVISDRHKAVKLGLNGRKMIEQKYTWGQKTQETKDLIDSMT